jgi:hypothetical protein
VLVLDLTILMFADGVTGTLRIITPLTLTMHSVTLMTSQVRFVSSGSSQFNWAALLRSHWCGARF